MRACSAYFQSANYASRIPAIRIRQVQEWIMVLLRRRNCGVSDRLPETDIASFVECPIKSRLGETQSRGDVQGEGVNGRNNPGFGRVSGYSEKARVSARPEPSCLSDTTRSDRSRRDPDRPRVDSRSESAASCDRGVERETWRDVFIKPEYREGGERPGPDPS